MLLKGTKNAQFVRIEMSYPKNQFILTWIDFIKKTSHQNIKIMNFRCFQKQVKVNENIYSLTYITCSIYIYIYIYIYILNIYIYIYIYIYINTHAHDNQSFWALFIFLFFHAPSELILAYALHHSPLIFIPI